MKTEYKIGQKIKHGPYYPMTCSERFISLYNEEDNNYIRNHEPTPIAFQGESFVVGLKRCIMSNYKYHAERTSQGFEDPWPEVEQASASGTFEECLVCVKTMKPFSPYLVRKKDVLI